MIRIQNTSFSYDEDGDAGLHDISLHIPKGQCILLTGASGCGKTTITRLIARFWDVDSGEVKMAGRISKICQATRFCPR